MTTQTWNQLKKYWQACKDNSTIIILAVCFVSQCILFVYNLVEVLK